MKRNPMTLDMARGVAGVAWDDAEPSDKRCAHRYGVSRRTATRYRHEGPPWFREALLGILKSTDPWRLVSTLLGTVKEASLQVLTDHDLVLRYNNLRVEESRREGEDNVMEREPGHPWIERAQAKERDVAINAELAACYREFFRRRLTEKEVYGG